MNHPSALGLAIEQKNMLKLSMKTTDNKMGIASYLLYYKKEKVEHIMT